MKCGDKKEECPRFTTPEFCPVTVVKKRSLLLPSSRKKYLILGQIMIED